MIITSQGYGHFIDQLNNQDFGIETPNMLLILDGCSGAKYSEIGTRLFAQIFSRKEECDSVDKFEDNVKCVFDELIKMIKPYYPTQTELENEYIMENLLFTIIACFNTEDEYIVKLFGDGYIVTQNNRGKVSYMKYSYGSCPPYYAYKYCEILKQAGEDYTDYQFKTFHFDKKVFPKICIATDGIEPIAKGIVSELDHTLVAGNEAAIKLAIKNERKTFYDDITIGRFVDTTNNIRKIVW